MAVQPLNRLQATAEILGVSHATVKRLIRDGNLRTVKIGRSVVVTAAEIDRFVTELDQSGGVTVAGKAGPITQREAACPAPQ